MTSLTIINTSDDTELSPDTLSTVLSDRGLAYGHGVFETMLSCKGEIPLKDRHLQRLRRGAERLGIPFLMDDIYSAIDNINSTSECIIKIILTAGNGGVGYQNPQQIEPKLIISRHQLPTDFKNQRERGIKLWQCQQRLSRNTALAGIKHLNRLEQVLARNEPHSDEYTDGIMLDQWGNVIETTSANIFIKLPNKGWVTPNLDDSGVEGVMRSLLLDEVFPNLAIACITDRIKQVQLEQSCELFICNSVRGIVPITGIESQNGAMKTLSIGENTQTLQRALHCFFSCLS